MRVDGGKPFTMADGSVGWIHKLDGATPRMATARAAEPAPSINATKMMEEWSTETNTAQFVMLGTKLGVSVQSLRETKCAWAPQHMAWAWPMEDGYGSYCGIRLRADSGAKWAVPGSHAGIFLPQCEPQTTAIVVEGPSDCAAALTLGYFGVGRPSCSGGMPHVRAAFKRLGVRRAIVVADNDTPGLRGAEMLARHLPIPTATLVLPTKDIRDFVRAGGDRQCMDAMIKGLVWRQPPSE
jgi:hypothetical protein